MLLGKLVGVCRRKTRGELVGGCEDGRYVVGWRWKIRGGLESGMYLFFVV